MFGTQSVVYAQMSFHTQLRNENQDMKSVKIKETLALVHLAMDHIKDPTAHEIISLLHNLVEDMYAEMVKLQKANQELKDEINRLKGEQGKPNIKGNSRQNNDVSTHRERSQAEQTSSMDAGYGYKLNDNSIDKLQEHDLPDSILDLLKTLGKQRYSTPEEFLAAVELIIGKEALEKHKDKLLKHTVYKKRNRKAKIPDIVINREEICYVDKDSLPEDARFVNYNEKVVQDIIIRPDNVKFKKEVFYSPSLHKTFTGKVPAGYEGEYGPEVNTQIVSMKYVNNMSLPKILESLRSYRIRISSTYISNRLTNDKSMRVFHEEKENLYHAGLKCGSYQQIDDTSCRVNGENKYVQIIGNPFYTAYFTTDRKDRLTILDILRFFKPRSYLFNGEAFELLKKMNVSPSIIEKLSCLTADFGTLHVKQMDTLLNQLFPAQKKGKITRIRIMEASAIAFYHQETGSPIVETLVCDDAPQFKLITRNLMLCWVHDGRHYKKLIPLVESHKKWLEHFQRKYWDFYASLFAFKQSPSEDSVIALSCEFDEFFSTQTGYEQLDERIKKTKAKKNELLTVLKFSELPLHNNLSENAARTQKRRQDVSLQTRNEVGTSSQNAMMSIVETCKKLKVNAVDYIRDRISKTFAMPSLASIIEEKSKLVPP